MDILKAPFTTKETIYKKGSFKVVLVRKDGQMIKVEMQGGGNFTNKEAIEKLIQFLELEKDTYPTKNEIETDIDEKSVKKKLPSFRDLEHINLSGDLNPTDYIRKLRDE